MPLVTKVINPVPRFPLVTGLRGTIPVSSSSPISPVLSLPFSPSLGRRALLLLFAAVCACHNLVLISWTPAEKHTPVAKFGCRKKRTGRPQTTPEKRFGLAFKLGWAFFHCKGTLAGLMLPHLASCSSSGVSWLLRQRRKPHAVTPWSTAAVSKLAHPEPPPRAPPPQPKCSPQPAACSQ